MQFHTPSHSMPPLDSLLKMFFKCLSASCCNDCSGVLPSSKGYINKSYAEAHCIQLAEGYRITSFNELFCIEVPIRMPYMVGQCTAEHCV